MTAPLFDRWAELGHPSLQWLALTLVTYGGALWVYRRSASTPLLLPVCTGAAAIILALQCTGTPYPVYFQGTALISLLVGPATVALAVPLVSQLARLKQIWLPVTVALLLGSGAAIVSAVLVAWALGASMETLMSLAPKSATMPIAMAVAEQWGGLAPLAACAVVLTGLAGTVLARPLLAGMQIHDPAVCGFAIGLTAHAIGTARELQFNATAGAFAALAMGLNGVATALLVPLAMGLFHARGFLL